MTARSLYAALMMLFGSFHCIAEIGPISLDATFQNNSFQSNPFQSNTFQSNTFQSNALQSNPFQSNLFQSNVSAAYVDKSDALQIATLQGGALQGDVEGNKTAQENNAEAVEQVDKMLSRLGGRKAVSYTHLTLPTSDLV